MGASVNSPKCRGKRKSTTLRHLFDLDSKSDGGGGGGGGALACTLPRPPPSPDSNADELIESISLCSRVFTFTDPSESRSERDRKRAELLRVLSALRSSPRAPGPRILPSLFAMIAANLFRPLPPSALPCHPCEPPLDDDFPVVALAPPWPHLHVIYDILSAAVATADPGSLREHAGRAFLSGLAALFRSEDPRERDRLKSAYHQIYSKLTCARSFMRRSMRDALLRFAAAPAERHCGIGELLEIWGSIIDGFAVPLKEEHRVFLRRVLIPLHRPKGMGAYHRQLSYCVMQFVRKEPPLCELVLRGMLRCWPATNCQKEVLMIGELEELVEVLDDHHLFEKLAAPLCSRIARCSNSCSSQVAERALYVWNNEQFVRMASRLMQEILPATVDGIENNLKTHWSRSVRQLTTSVKSMLEEMEPELYAKCLEEIGQRESAAGREASRRKARWERLEMMAAVNNQLLRPPVGVELCTECESN